MNPGYHISRVRSSLLTLSSIQAGQVRHTFHSFKPLLFQILNLYCYILEARQLGHNYIGTEHLLIGLLREGGGVAARVLENLDADPSKIRGQVIRMVGAVLGLLYKS